MTAKRVLAADTVKEIGKEVTLMGWVGTRRDHGKITFVDLRDRSGIVQVVDTASERNYGPEDVVKITGAVKSRPAKMVNPKIPSGTVEIEAREIEILSKAVNLPFPIDTDGYDINEEIRL